MANNFLEVEISVVIYPENGDWIAQGLEYDITARGNSPVEAAKRFGAKVGAEFVMSDELEDEKPLAGVAAAPQEFWRMFDEGICVHTERPPIRILDGAQTPRYLPRMRVGQLAAA